MEHVQRVLSAFQINFFQKEEKCTHFVFSLILTMSILRCPWRIFLVTVWYACKFIGIANIIAIKVNTSMKLFELLGANGNQVLSNLSHKDHGVKVCLSLNSRSLLTINVTHETLIYFSVSTYLWLLASDILLLCAWMLFQLGLFDFPICSEFNFGFIVSMELALMPK